MSDLEVVKYPLLEASVREAPTIPVDKNGKIYNFLVFNGGPSSERANYYSPDMIDEISNGLFEEYQSVVESEGDVKKIATIHTTGTVNAALLAQRVRKPIGVFTTEPNYEGQDEVAQIRGYGDRPVYAPSFSEDEEVVIIDDVLSLGGTAEMMVNHVRKSLAVARAILVVIDKSGNAAEISEKLELPVIALVDASKIRE